MFNKEKTTTDRITSNNATLVSAGTTLSGDLNSANDLRIDGTIKGNVNSSAKIIIGATGFVEGDISCQQADIAGKVTGNVSAQDLLQLREECNVEGNIAAAKLQIEPTAIFNGKCTMTPAENAKQKTKHEPKPTEAVLYQ